MEKKITGSPRFRRWCASFAFDIFFLVAADALLKLFELFEDIPILKPGEGRASEEVFSTIIVAMAGHAVFAEEFLSSFSIVLQCESGLDAWELANVSSECLEFGRFEGVGDSFHS